MVVAVFDADVLISIFDDIHKTDKEKFKEIMNFLQLRFSSIWIPATVREEITILKKEKKRRERIMQKYEDFISSCPISIGDNDIALLLNKIDRGEADGILQTMRAPDYRFIKKRGGKYVFVSHDKKALKFAERMNLPYVDYKEIVEELREAGVEIDIM